MRPLLISVVVLSAACQPAPQEQAPVPFALPAGTVVDLSYSYDDSTIFWPTADGFQLEADFEGITDKGYYYTANTFCAAEHGGTHIDAPIHFSEGKASVDECVIHDLRRSAITNWAKKLPIQVVQELAGHSDISTTRKYYLAVRSEDLASANKFLNQILAKARTN